MSQLEEIQEALKGLNDSELAEVSDFIAELAGDEEEDEDDDEENDVEIDEDGEDEDDDEDEEDD